MLEEIILIILSLIATSVIDHLLIICRNTDEHVLVVKFQLLLQLLRNDVLMVPFQLLLQRNDVLCQSLQKTHTSHGGVVEQFAVNMKKENHLSPLKKAIAVFTPVMTTFQQEHRVYKFQIAVTVVFHKAVEPAVVIQPPVTLTSEMVAVYSDASPPLEDVYRQLLNFIEVYEHNGSGWVFSNFVSLQLTLWHLDPLRASAFVPLPRCSCHWHWRRLFQMGCVRHTRTSKSHEQI